MKVFLPLPASHQEAQAWLEVLGDGDDFSLLRIWDNVEGVIWVSKLP